MQRRDVVKLGLYSIPAAWTLGLSACGGGGSGSGGSSVTPPPVTPQHSLGLQFATPAQLAQILKAPGVGNAPVPPASFLLTDDAAMAAAGFPLLIPPINDQGQMSSCVAWGCGYALASAYRTWAGGPPPTSATYQASPADLYAALMVLEQNMCGNGTLVKDALDILVVSGVDSLAEVPYIPGQCVNPSSDQVNRFTIENYFQGDPTDTLSIKNAIRWEGRPLPIGMTVYQDFESWSGAGVYSHSASDPSQPLGGHCVAVVGYDDGLGAFRIMNSWGTGWGDNGFIWMDYATFGVVVQEVYMAGNPGTAVNVNSMLPSSTTVSGSVTLKSATCSLLAALQGSEPYGLTTSFEINPPVQVQTVEVNYVDPNPANSFLVGQLSCSQFLHSVDLTFGVTAAQKSTIEADKGYFSTAISGMTPQYTNNPSVAFSVTANTTLTGPLPP